MPSLWTKEIKAVIFDADNTLLATDKSVLNCLKKTVIRLNEQGIAVSLPTEDKIKAAQAENLPFEDIFKKLFVGSFGEKNLWEVALIDYREYAGEEKYEATFGAVGAVKKLIAAGVVVGVVTNRKKMIAERLAQAGFAAQDFAFICSPSAPEFAKPHPRVFGEALEILKSRGIYADQTVMIGDHPNDYYSAFYQNINFAAVLQGRSTGEDFIKCGLENYLIFADLNDIDGILESVVKINAHKVSLNNYAAVDGRYRAFTLPLRHYFSEYAFYKYRVRVEIEHLIALSEFFEDKVVRPLSGEEKKSLRALYQNFSWHEAYEILQYDHLGREGVGPTEHDCKSVELWIKEKIIKTTGFDIIPSLHIFLTSEDVRNLALKTMLAEATNDIFVPAVYKICDQLKDLANKYASDPVMGRTHLQPASPTTFGKIFANYLSRLTDGLERLDQVALTGKVNGAVGNYNAFVVAFPALDWLGYSRELTKRFGLNLNLYTDQRGSQNDVVRLFQAFQEIGNVIRDLAVDLSLYAGLKTIYFSKIESHVGSSVMPHKINPWFAEVAEGNIKKANSLINGLSNDLDVSRLQRDLSDHDWERSYGELFGYVLIAIEHISIALGLARPDTEYAKKELEANPQIVGEAIQTILRVHGVEDAYSLIKERTRGENISAEDLPVFVESLDITDAVKRQILANLDPEKYLGLAVELTRGAVGKYEGFRVHSA
ncbi:MAG: lyase family protein [Patescibacteria group bacterium]